MESDRISKHRTDNQTCKNQTEWNRKADRKIRQTIKQAIRRNQIESERIKHNQKESARIGQKKMEKDRLSDRNSDRQSDSFI